MSRHEWVHVEHAPVLLIFNGHEEHPPTLDLDQKAEFNRCPLHSQESSHAPWY